MTNADFPSWKQNEARSSCSRERAAEPGIPQFDSGRRDFIVIRSFNSMNINQILARLSQSKFRSSFKLSEKDKIYIEEKGIKTIEQHAYDFLTNRIKIKPLNYGRQTPFIGHPVFVAQHATASCCRKCIEKWHRIERSKVLSNEEINYLSNILIYWIKLQIRNNKV